ncbi:MAG: hypothetical protein U5L45_07240 [Saprospiraceae bacterium]|nr:hypothetical protein [Saprospiraceae bacterium]
MVRFSAKPKNEPHSPPSRERSEREMQKMLLGYAHPSFMLFRAVGSTNFVGADFNPPKV